MHFEPSSSDAFSDAILSHVGSADERNMIFVRLVYWLLVVIEFDQNDMC